MMIWVLHCQDTISSNEQTKYKEMICIKVELLLKSTHYVKIHASLQVCIELNDKKRVNVKEDRWPQTSNIRRGNRVHKRQTQKMQNSKYEVKQK